MRFVVGHSQSYNTKLPLHDDGRVVMDVEQRVTHWTSPVLVRIAEFCWLPELNAFRQISRATRRAFEIEFQRRIYAESQPGIPIGLRLHEGISRYTFVVGNAENVPIPYLDPAEMRDYLQMQGSEGEKRLVYHSFWGGTEPVATNDLSAVSAVKWILDEAVWALRERLVALGIIKHSSPRMISFDKMIWMGSDLRGGRTLEIARQNLVNFVSFAQCMGFLVSKTMGSDGDANFHHVAVRTSSLPTNGDIRLPMLCCHTKEEHCIIVNLSWYFHWTLHTNGEARMLEFP